jgi:hypothetical protein
MQPLIQKKKMEFMQLGSKQRLPVRQQRLRKVSSSPCLLSLRICSSGMEHGHFGYVGSDLLFSWFTFLGFFF